MADPICRWRNSSVKQVLEFNSLLPLTPTKRETARGFVERRWNLMGGSDFFTTPYQLAAQMGMYYEDDSYLYPRFSKLVSLEEANDYLAGWGKKYYAPNPYTRSMNSKQKPVIINNFLVNWTIEHKPALFSEALREMFSDNIGNTDILTNMINNFTDVNVQGDVMTLKPNVPEVPYDIVRLDVDSNDKKYFFEYFKTPIEASVNLVERSQPCTLQQIYYGAPGTGKSHTIKKLTAGENVIRTTFHPDSDYSTFVGAYKPTTREVDLRDVSGHKIVENGSVVREERIVYEFVAQAFLQSYVNAWKLYAENPEEPAKQYLVIEEINRGNCAQIFGDLFQLLDRNDYGFSDYPIAADSDLSKHLKKELAGLTLSNADSINSMYNGRDVASEILNGKILILPNNLYIWATMNTSDQSLFPIDSAFKRRWEWKYIPIDTGKEKWSISVNGKSYSWSSFLKRINEEIDDTTHSEDKKLGFYFCKAIDGVVSADRFVGKVLFYLYNDVFKDYNFARDFLKDASGKTIPFQTFFNCTDGSTNDNAVETILKNLRIDLVENAVAVDTADVTTDTSEDEMLDDDGNTPSSSTRDYSKYSINHEGRYDKRSLVRNTISIFIRQHSELPDDEIISKWKSLNVFNKFVLTESEYNRELDSSSDRSGRQSRFFDFELPNSHTHMYVYNQFNVGSIEAFINKVNAQDWGIHLEKIE